MLAVVADVVSSKTVGCSRVRVALYSSIKMGPSTSVSRAIRHSLWTTWFQSEVPSLPDCMINWIKQLTHRHKQTWKSFSLRDQDQLCRHLKRLRATLLWSRTKIAKLVAAKSTHISILTTVTYYFKRMSSLTWQMVHYSKRICSEALNRWSTQELESSVSSSKPTKEAKVTSARCSNKQSGRKKKTTWSRAWTFTWLSTEPRSKCNMAKKSDAPSSQVIVNLASLSCIKGYRISTESKTYQK